MQIYFLTHRFNQVVQVQQNPLPTIQDRTIYEDVHILNKGLHNLGIMQTCDFGGVIMNVHCNHWIENYNEFLDCI